MVRVLFLTIVFCALALSSCARKSAATPHATVYLRDGTTVAGSVLDSSPAEIKIAADGAATRTIPMSEVRSVEYDDAAAPAAGSQPAQPGAPAAAPDPVHERHYHPAEAAITTKTYSLPVGTEISVRNEETIDSAKAVEGQSFAAEITKDVLDANGSVVIPRGSNAQIVIRSASKGGRFRGASDLVLDLSSVAVDGRQYRLSTTDLAQRGREGIGANKRTAEFAGGGAAVGAIIGAIAGHGKGAAIGGASGGGAGALAEVLTKGGAIRVPVETVMTFKLDQPLRVIAAQ